MNEAFVLAIGWAVFGGLAAWFYSRGRAPHIGAL